MSENVIPLRLVVLGDGATIDPDQVLDVAKGEFTQVVVVGEREDGEIEVRGSHGAAPALMLLQWASHYLVSNRVTR